MQYAFRSSYTTKGSGAPLTQQLNRDLFEEKLEEGYCHGHLTRQRRRDWEDYFKHACEEIEKMPIREHTDLLLMEYRVRNLFSLATDIDFSLEEPWRNCDFSMAWAFHDREAALN